MCGIFSYVGKRNDAAEITLTGLKALEYRGYDSWGIAEPSGDKMLVDKHVGKISVAKTSLPNSNIAMGHVRWATHGVVTDENAHPHLDCHSSLSLIHNGIVENYQELKSELSDHHFLSQTDTEVIAHHLEELIPNLGTRQALREIFNRSHGLNAFVILNSKDNKIVAAKNGSPIVLGVGSGENFLASDSSAILPHTNKLIFLEDGQLAELTPDSIKLFDAKSGKEILPQITEVDWKVEDDSLGNYDHYMIKEISEQPRVIRQIATAYAPQIENLAESIKNSYGTYFIGCGTAANAALIGIYLFDKVAKRHTNFAPGSEFNYLEDFLTPRSLIIALSQSGETIDVIEPVTAAKKKGVKLAAIVNNLGSTLYRMSDEKYYSELVPSAASVPPSPIPPSWLFSRC